MLLLYTILSSIVYWIILPYTFLRSVAGSKLWHDRLGWGERTEQTDIWLHAASVGEVQILSHLIDYLLSKRDLQMHITVVTKAGYKTALQLYAGKVPISYLPMDCPVSMRKKFDNLQPTMIVIAETEIWPRLIVTANRRSIPIVMVNARMTERGYRRYNLIRNAISSLLTTYQHFFFKTEDDAVRYYQFGVEKNNSTVTGDMKFDAPLTPRSEGRVRELQSRLTISSDEFILIAGSTRTGEEELLIDFLKKCREAQLNIRLVVAPRHIERADHIHELFQSAGLTTCIYGTVPKSNEVVIVQEIGLLKELYMAADLAFVGGTFVEIGGHNLLEPVWAGVPVVYGSSLFNVLDLAKYISEHNYGKEVKSIDDMYHTVMQMTKGEISFARKDRTDDSQSATSVAGEYILKAFAHA